MSRVGVGGLVLAGGRSRRMGIDKRFLPFEGRPLVARAIEIAASVAEEVLVAANDPDRFAAFPVRVVRDEIRDAGPLAGLHAGLRASTRDLVFALPCDLPFVEASLVRGLREIALGGDFDVVCPRTRLGPEPLLGFFRRACVAAIEAAVAQGRRKATAFYPLVRTRIVSEREWRPFDPEGRSFVNLNTRDDVAKHLVREEPREAARRRTA